MDKGGKQGAVGLLQHQQAHREFRKRLLTVWHERGNPQKTEQKLAGQSLAIRRIGLLTAVEREVERTQQRPQREEEQGGGPQPTLEAKQWTDDQSEIEDQIRREPPTRQQEESTGEQTMILEESERTRDLNDLHDAEKADLSYLEEQREE